MKKISNFFKKTEGKFIASLALLIAALFAYYFYAMRDYVPPVGPEVTVSETDHVRGALNGKVTMVEFGDFQCPACSAYEPIVRQVMRDNSDTLKVVFRHFPLVQIHRNALLSAKASEAAALQGKFWEMHDILYEKHDEWADSFSAYDLFLVYARTIGLDTKKFAQDINSKAIEEKILAEFKEGNNLGIMGTPTFFINGKMINSPQSVEEFDKLIKEAAK